MKRLKMVFWNANGLMDKIDELTAFMETEDVDVALISETWCRPNAHNSIPHMMINLHGPRKINTGRYQYGLALVANRQRLEEIKNSIKLLALDEEDRTYIWIQAGDVKIGFMYLPPALDEEQCLKALRSIDSIRTGPMEKIIMLGDFNMRLKEETGDTQSNTRGRHIKPWFTENGMTLKKAEQGKWTFMRREQRAVIDLVWTSKMVDENTLRINIMDEADNFGSDHNICLATVKIDQGISKNHPKTTGRIPSYRLIREEEIRRLFVDQCNVKSLAIRNELEERWTYWKENQKTNVKDVNEEWINRNIKKYGI